jgi:hypothetical protein
MNGMCRETTNGQGREINNTKVTPTVKSNTGGDEEMGKGREGCP